MLFRQPDCLANLETAREVGEQLSAIPWRCRNGAPKRLLFVMENGLLRPESLPKELVEAWSMVEAPETALPRSLWTTTAA